MVENHIKRRELQTEREGDGKIKERRLCVYLFCSLNHLPPQNSFFLFY